MYITWSLQEVLKLVLKTEISLIKYIVSKSNKNVPVISKDINNFAPDMLN